MIESFLKLMFDTEPQIQKSQTRGSRLNPPQTLRPKHIISEL